MTSEFPRNSNFCPLFWCWWLIILQGLGQKVSSSFLFLCRRDLAKVVVKVGLSYEWPCRAEVHYEVNFDTMRAHTVTIPARYYQEVGRITGTKTRTLIWAISELKSEANIDFPMCYLELFQTSNYFIFVLCMADSASAT